MGVFPHIHTWSQTTDAWHCTDCSAMMAQVQFAQGHINPESVLILTTNAVASDRDTQKLAQDIWVGLVQMD